MPDLSLLDESPPPNDVEEPLGFTVFHQRLDLEIDLPRHILTGSTTITIHPQSKTLKRLRFNLHQAVVHCVTVQEVAATFAYDDSYARLNLPERVDWGIEQYQLQKERIEPVLTEKPRLGELQVDLPPRVNIVEADSFFVGSTVGGFSSRERTNGARTVSIGANGEQTGAMTPVSTPRPAEDAQFQPLHVCIHYTIKDWRDGLQWVGLEAGDQRYPHVYTRHSLQPGMSSSMFPCIDDPLVRNTWDISIKCGKTLGDAMKISHPIDAFKSKRYLSVPGHDTQISREKGEENVDIANFTEEDKQLEMMVICSGDFRQDSTNLKDNTQTVVYHCPTQVAARHVGFAVGPFTAVDLSSMRDASDDEKLGQKAIQVTGYCLPRRQDDLRNICGTLPSAIDYYSLKFGGYPFSDYKVCFVDDLQTDSQPLASLSFHSTRLLLPEDILDPEVEYTHKIAQALASQWMGINIINAVPSGLWMVIGVSHFMSEQFMRHLCGNNEYRFRQKTRSDRLVELDVARPSLMHLGETAHIGPFQLDFIALKAPLVLFILDQRLMKASGNSIGMARVLGKIFFEASTQDQLQYRTLHQERFKRWCEKTGHMKLDGLFLQYVAGAGCPKFSVTQKFNKKRLSVEMIITQKQDTEPTKRKLKKDDFLREFKEEYAEVYAGDIQTFTGPMTIRIHEADGTPYEHIVEIRDPVEKIEIPYHTKYKRLKRSRREKERAIAGPGASANAELNGDNENDILLYSLGDTLQSPEDIKAWDLKEWDAEMEAKMDQESYEWIRMDADFEWLCELTINMPAYMYVSQLQQDRDVVAQQDSMLYLSKSAPHPLVSTILVRTLMDRRYFHGIRTLAISYLPKHATESLQWIGRRHLEKAFQHFYCNDDSNSMPRSNDFSDKMAYIIQCAIPRAMAKIRDGADECPKEARRFILDQLSFNDNHSNEYSDHFYVANLMLALADSLLPLREVREGEFNLTFENEDSDERKEFIASAMEEIDRYRRMDEWDPSFHNIYTTTALECKQRLMSAKVIPTNPVEFFRYAHDDVQDLVRIKAIDILVELGLFTRESFFRYFMRLMSTDSSPYVREKLFGVFGKGLAGIAFGENSQPSIEAAPHQEMDGLILEEHVDVDFNAKKALAERTMSITGALLALTNELRQNNVFKDVLWETISSKQLSPWNQGDILDLCHFIVPPVESMTLKLKLPRYWKVEKIGKGLLCFKQTDKIRTKRMPLKELNKVTLKLPLASTSTSRLSIALPGRSSNTGTAPAPIKLKAGPTTAHIKPVTTATPLVTSSQTPKPIPQSSVKSEPIPLTLSAIPSANSTSVTTTKMESSPAPTPKNKNLPQPPPITKTPTPASSLGNMKPPLNPLKRPHIPDRTSSVLERPSKMVKLTLTKEKLSHYPRGETGKKRKLLPTTSSTPTNPTKTKTAPVTERTPLNQKNRSRSSTPASTGSTMIRKPLPTGGPSSFTPSERKALPTERKSLPGAKPDTFATGRTPLPPTPTNGISMIIREPPGTSRKSLKIKLSVGKNRLPASPKRESNGGP